MRKKMIEFSFVEHDATNSCKNSAIRSSNSSSASGVQDQRRRSPRAIEDSKRKKPKPLAYTKGPPNKDQRRDQRSTISTPQQVKDPVPYPKARADPSQERA
ncbi:hypothetical protein SISNIDRAFT_109373 [Sistotremastrum niveocremeum HHB9708]|uniref:Uncharacterized protein n=1 Tax=Sistotremastrum niveocremeum HHB9708 TaxID=1314777 RepID=A0A164U0J1_9AGAM|nr:hypothetical protein SISNIDRAFT_109373 [Sistotremastrum niveocremeum HHB9708]